MSLEWQIVIHTKYLAWPRLCTSASKAVDETRLVSVHDALQDISRHWTYRKIASWWQMDTTALSGNCLNITQRSVECA